MEISSGSRLAALCQLVVEHLGKQESQFEALRGVEARVAMGVVAIREALLGHRDRAARALRHILPGHLGVDTTAEAAFRAMHGEEAANFRKDALERPCL